MTANTTPIFVDTPIIGLGRIAGANTARDGSGSNLVDLVTGDADGTRIDRIVIHATVTTTAGMVRFFIYDGSSLSRIFWEVPVTAITVGTSTAAFSYEMYRTDHPELPLLVLPNGYILRMGSHNNEAIDATVHGGHY